MLLVNIFMILMKDGIFDPTITGLSIITDAKLQQSISNVIGDCKQILIILFLL